jgi:hypothetical protein
MVITRTKLTWFTIFWIVLIAWQYYFLYRKFETLKVCRDQQARVESLETQVDRLKASGRPQ